MKQYTITSGRCDSHHLEIHNGGIPVYWINSNNKYGPWKSPYVTLQQASSNGAVVAAAKMGYPGWERDFKVYQGNPDCTDLKTWPAVKCLGKSASEYRFIVEGGKQLDGQLPLRFAWRRTRDQSLGASRQSHRDFKLIVLDSPSSPNHDDSSTSSSRALRSKTELSSIHLEEIDTDEIRSEEKCPVNDLDVLGHESARNVCSMPGKNERVIGVYIHESKWTARRQARINFFEFLPLEEELLCLTVLMGLQEKISCNKDAFTLASFGYGGGLRVLGNYI